MDCIELFKKAAAAMQTDPRLLALTTAQKACDDDQALQELIGPPWWPTTRPKPPWRA